MPCSKQQRACLFDHLVGEQGPWHGEAERLGGLHIDDELVFGRCLNWKVGWLLAFEDAVNVTGCADVGINGRWPVGEEAATMGEIAERIDRRQPVSTRKRNDEISMRCCRGTSRHDQTTVGNAGEVPHCIFDFTSIANSGWSDFDPDRAGCGLNGAKLASASRIDVSQYDCSPQIRLDRLEKAKPFSGHAEVELSKSRHIAARTREAFDIAGTNWVRHLCEHDRYAACPVE